MSSVIQFNIEIAAPEIDKMKIDILKEFLNHLTNIVNSATPFIQAKLAAIVEDALHSSSEWAALNAGGELEQLFCIPSPAQSLFQIQRSIIDNISFTTKPVNINGMFITGGFSIGILSDSYSEVLSSTDISYITITGKRVPWLEWLLFYGGGILIDKGTPVRTKRGTLIGRSTTDLRVPPAYSGTPNNNFLTRALIPIEPIIGKMIEEEISRRS